MQPRIGTVACIGMLPLITVSCILLTLGHVPYHSRIVTAMQIRPGLQTMSDTVIFSIIESPIHPNFSPLYKKHGLLEVRVESMRKAISQLRQHTPKVVVAEFFYGYGNNYAGINISNVDVFLLSLQKYTRDAKVIIMVDKSERQYVDKLAEQYPLHAILTHPVRTEDMNAALNRLN